jgi:hypothetical protein
VGQTIQRTALLENRIPEVHAWLADRL